MIPKSNVKRNRLLLTKKLGKLPFGALDKCLGGEDSDKESNGTEDSNDERKPKKESSLPHKFKN